MEGVDAEEMDSVNNNSMSNNNNSSNINNNTITAMSNAGASGAPDINGSQTDSTTAAATAVEAAATAETPTPTVCTVSSFSSSRSRSSSSRRGRSSGRSRSRSRHRHSHTSGRRGSRHSSRQNHKPSERNVQSALCSMVTIVILCTALAEPRWVSIEDGHCTLPKGRTLNYLGVFHFFSVGYIMYNDPNVAKNVEVIVEYRYGSGEDDRMINCVTERAVVIFKIIIGLTFLAIFTSLVSFGLDLIGSGHRLLKLLRRSAIFNIFTVLVCVGVILFLYCATVDILHLQQQIPNSNAKVSFDVSFYLVAAGGFISVLGVACSCLRRVRVEADAPSARAILDEQFNPDTEQLITVPPHSLPAQQLSPMANLPPPPPYTP